MRDDIECILRDNIAEDDVFLDASDLYEKLDYNGNIHLIVDNHIDHINYNLRVWAVDNYDSIEEALEEGLAEGVTDFHKLIQCGQYVKFSEEAREIVDQLFNEYDGELFNVEEEEQEE